jgi:hypothetical protein
MPIQHRPAGRVTTRQLDLDHIRCDHLSGALSGTPQHAGFIEVRGQPSYRSRMPLTRLAFLMATQSTDVTLMQA